jgi:hypothetical protein
MLEKGWQLFLSSLFCFAISQLKKEGIWMEIADIRNQLNQMSEKITSFRGSL